MRFLTLLPAAALFETSIAGYVLQDDYMTDFFGNFNFFTGPDPTKGFVKYIDQTTAQQTGLISNTSTTKMQWGVDVQNKTPEGRPSIRLESKKRYDRGLIVIDVAHMPFGCGTWPAFWTFGPNWPNSGEIDILEGVNDQTNNGMTLHTGPGCKIGEDRTVFSGTVDSQNCDINAEGQSKNKGCTIKHPSTQSYGEGLNAIGGGVYAVDWTDQAISVYFFPRNSIPEDVLGASPNPSGWGKPAAKFTGGCNIPQFIKQQQIVFDTTFCGEWAGADAVWGASSCAQKAPKCVDYVRDNPTAFKEAYWTVNALRVYQNNAAGGPVSPAPQSPGVQSPSPAPIRVSTQPDPAVSTPPAQNTPSRPNFKNPLEQDAVDPQEPVQGRPPIQPQSPMPSPTRPTRPDHVQNSNPADANGNPDFRWPLGEAEGDSLPKFTPPPANGAQVARGFGGDLAAREDRSFTPNPANLVPRATDTIVPRANDVLQARSDGPSILITADLVPRATDNPVPHANAARAAQSQEADEITTSPTPLPNKARYARHIRQHRRRLTKHNVAM
ncbi:hypothetical protein IAQ61_004299 [Plenodomus lingam]|uniref:endo-1,3(4)-beta-glucanase n=1 Tax=Leptosphaeria maculans (strain JN3 / isolate v23.1.3 / race Av1-4-5-6-7-8) TaxID=985895 RepID=E4ZV48_LEPMJ|nr:hypothetical protein LEMA_P026260.1 [Plenodomus lingam JN3]KAH9873674.1 hypothetical protein IAQ61_004299 [Plenodomus lingam]CBX95474.1 hypothetical protein LEMA_P026260.1 [Plenodomus lingam JN3]